MVHRTGSYYTQITSKIYVRLFWILVLEFLFSFGFREKSGNVNMSPLSEVQSENRVGVCQW